MIIYYDNIIIISKWAPLLFDWKSSELIDDTTRKMSDAGSKGSISQYNIILSVILGILYIILNTNKAKFEHFSNDDDEDDDDDDDDDEDNEDIDNNDDADDSTNDSVDNNSKDEDEDEYKDKDIEQLNSSNNNNCIRNCLSQNISDNCKDFCNVPIEHDDQTDIDNSNNIIKNAKRNRNEINRLKKKMMKSSKNI